MPPGTKKTTRMKSTPSTKSGCWSGVRRTDGSCETACELRGVAQAVVGIRVEDAAEQRAPARACAADHDHHEQCQREVGAGDVGGRAAEQQQVDDAARGREERREHERHQLVRVRAQAEHLDAQLVLADRLPDVAGRRADRPLHDDEDDSGVAERKPVEVLGVEDADERLGQLRVVGAEPLLAARPLVRVLEDEDRAGLRERERHHRERDPADAQRDGAERERQKDADERCEGERRRRSPSATW